MKRSTKLCSKCNRDISLSNFSKHEVSCKGKDKTPSFESLKTLKDGTYQCPHCPKSFSKMGIKSHIWSKHTKEGKDFSPIKKGERVAWNKGMTKETNKNVAKFAETLSRKLKSGEIVREYSDETKKKLSESLKGRAGGCRKGSGRGKSGWYKGYWCDSTWELAFVIYNIDHEISFIRNKEGFSYEFEGKVFKYYPDFIMKNGVYIEIKGFETEKDLAKYVGMKNKKLKILKKKEMKHIFDYVYTKYTKNLVELYE